MSETLQDLLTKRDELRQELAKLDEQIITHQAQQRRESIERLRAMMAQEGLTLADLAEETKVTRGPGKTHPIKGRKVAPKYRDQATGQEWSGRGIKPKWLQKAIASGKTIEEFIINP